MIVSYLQQKLSEEYQQLSLWYFISFISGIIIFFNKIYLGSAFCWLLAFLVLLLPSYLLIFYKEHILSRFLFFCLIFFLFGFSIATLRDHLTQITPIEKITKAKITGKITSIKPTLRGQQITLNINASNLTRTLSKVRINIAKKFDQILSIGDLISLEVKLFPLQTALLPGTYDFSFFMRLTAIEAGGYALQAPKIISQHHSNIFAWLKLLRQKIYRRLIEILGDEKGNFAAAILIGQTKAIPEEMVENMRNSGIAHILSVSGLHLSLVAMIFFLTSRFILNISNFLAYHTNIKAIAAVISLLGSFAYLQLSGNNIAALRAFIMTSIFIIAIIFDRDIYPIRSVLLAGFFILCFSPEYIFHPAFQLSFTAVLCLIAGYELYVKQFAPGRNPGIFSTMKAYLYSNIYTSFIASLATLPLLIYHFYKFPNYSIIMNLIAVPLMSFFVMPLALISVLLMPFALDEFTLSLLSYFIGLINALAAYLVSQPYAITYFGHISSLNLIIFIFGFFWLCLWQSPWRHFGFLLIFLALLLTYIEKKPIFLYDHQLKVAAVKNSVDKNITIYAKRPINKFITNYWQNWFGAPKSTMKLISTTQQDITFDLDHDITLTLNYQNCQKANIMVILSSYLRCKPSQFPAALMINKLAKSDKLLIYYSPQGKYRVKIY